MPIHPEKGRKMKKSNPREGVGKKIRGRLRGLMALMLAFVISIGMLPMQAVQADYEDQYFIVNVAISGKPVFFGKDLDSTGLTKDVVYKSDSEHLEYSNADKKWTIKSDKLEQRNIFNVNETTIIEIENNATLNFGTQWNGGGSGAVMVILDGENKGEGGSGNYAKDTSITKGKYSVLYETYGGTSKPCVKLTITTFSGYSVNLSGGANSTISGASEQTGLDGPMEEVTYTAKDGYHFAEFADITDNGITAKRTSSTVVTVSGTPTADATITVPDAVTNDEADDTQQNPDGTKTVTKENADGKTISVTNYSKTDEQISQFVFKKAKGTTLDLINVNSKTLKTVVIPESVKANGNTYKVTRIRKGFLKNCKQATKVDIGKNINTIDKKAFNYGKKVQKVVIRGKLKKVGKNAFKNTKKNVVIKVKTNAKNFKKNKTLLEKSGLPKNATVKRVKNKK